MRLARSAPSLSDETNISAWLFTVARNLVYSHSRWASTDREVRKQLETGDSAPNATPYQNASLSQTQELLEVALRELRPKYREALLLVSVEGLGPAEAAAIAGVTPEAMRQRLSRARAELGEALEHAARTPTKKRAQR